ncbi:MAG: 50S ribosomal protein L11 methyltransferase, partial [Verrucomicrobia bacterium]|nr:50S ribosomal protein L11 methyltransferase [Verrucomicrobiota bacterium]
MRYWECILDTPAEEIDKRCEELAALGIGGFVIESEDDFRSFFENYRQYWDYVDHSLEDQYRGLSRVKFYLTEDTDGTVMLNQLQKQYPLLIVSSVEDSGWENNWRNYYQPIAVGEHLAVVPEWKENPFPDRIPLFLDPGLIFGTGSHPTTRMCLRAMECFVTPGMRTLDLGCGSGILGIGTILLGAENCLGCDIDPKAPAVVIHNASLNDLDENQMRAMSGDILSDSSLRASFGNGYDMVLANIVADVIIPLTGYVPSFLKHKGIYICSGIIESRQLEVRTALERNGFHIIQHMLDEEWHCFVSTLDLPDST